MAPTLAHQEQQPGSVVQALVYPVEYLASAPVLKVVIALPLTEVPEHQPEDLELEEVLYLPTEALVVQLLI